MEDKPNEPRLEEYGLTPISYENHRNQKYSLEKSFNEYNELRSEDKWEGSAAVLMVFGGLFSLITFSTGNREGDFFPFIICICLFFAGLYLNNRNNLIDKEIREENEKKEKKVDLIKAKVYAFEEACIKYYLAFYEEFYQNNLYRKHHNTEKYKQSSETYSSIKNEIIAISQKLIFWHYSLNDLLKDHKDCLVRHMWKMKNNKNRLFNAFNDVHFKDGVDKEIEAYRENTQNIIFKTNAFEAQQEEIISESLVFDQNKIIKEEFRKKREIEKIDEEKIRLMPPEKRFRVARKIDNWEEINRKRKETGDKGEEIVFLIEQDYLRSINRIDLADRIKHIAKEDDGSGYDILSFFENGREKYIEVKSTTTSLKSPYYVSNNELSFLKEHNEDYRLYRVLLIDSGPEMRVYEPSEILEINDITPTQYIVKER
jgi:hypothetical protein